MCIILAIQRQFALTKMHKKCCLLCQTLCMTFLSCQVATHSLCDVTNVRKPHRKWVKRGWQPGNLETSWNSQHGKNTGQACEGNQILESTINIWVSGPKCFQNGHKCFKTGLILNWQEGGWGIRVGGWSLYSGQKKKLSAPKQVQNFPKMINSQNFLGPIYSYRSLQNSDHNTMVQNRFGSHW